jgi:hypothetical protein
MMAQRFPHDYDGILAGAPAIHWDKFQAYQIWPQLAMEMDAGGPIARSKQDAATAAAVASCDPLDGVTDGVIRDPRACSWDARELECPPAAAAAAAAAGMTSASASASAACLTPGEASAINRIWDGSRDMKGELLWYGIKRGASMAGLAGPTPFEIAVAQPRYWVYLNPSWDWKTALNYSNYQAFFDKTVKMVEPMIGTDNADLKPFRDAGGKLVRRPLRPVRRPFG